MSDAVAISIVTGVVSLIGIILTGWINIRLSNLHKQINSRMDELLESSKREANAIGNKAGRKELKEEQKNK